MKSTLGITAALTLLVGCAERDAGVTERDAVDLGFEPVDCSTSVASRIYVMPDSTTTTIDHCRAIEEAHRVAVSGAIVSREGPSADSIEVITCWIGRYAEAPGEPNVPEFFFDVTFDLRSSQDNVRVILDRPSGGAEVSWAPEGLRY